MRKRALGALLLLTAFSLGPGASAPLAQAPETLQAVPLPPETVSLRSAIEKELADLEALAAELEGYSKGYAETPVFRKLAPARENARRQALTKAALIPDMLSRLDALCASLQIQGALMLLDRGNFAKAHLPEAKARKAAQDYIRYGSELKTRVLVFEELREIFPRKAAQRLAAVRKTLDSEEAAFQRASEARESVKQMWALAAIGGVTLALLLAVAAVRRRRL